LDNIRTKSHKYMEGLEKIYIRPMIELKQYEYDTAPQKFRDLRGFFKGMHGLKYAQYIERVEADLKSNPLSFFKFANLKRNSSDYVSAMFLGDTCARNAQEIVDLFGGYLHGVYMRDHLQEGFHCGRWC
jgi:hypothetical protein